MFKLVVKETGLCDFRDGCARWCAPVNCITFKRQPVIIINNSF